LFYLKVKLNRSDLLHVLGKNFGWGKCWSWNCPVEENVSQETVQSRNCLVKKGNFRLGKCLVGEQSRRVTVLKELSVWDCHSGNCLSLNSPVWVISGNQYLFILF